MSRPYTLSDFRAHIRTGPYAWPGGYPLYFLTADGCALSFESAKAERRNIIDAIASDDTGSGWRVMAMDINYEDESLTCDHSGKAIESAYGDEQ